MLLNERITVAGNLFFKYRSFVFPVGLSVLMVLERRHFYYFNRSHTYDLIFELICFAVALLGFSIRLIAVGYSRAGTSGRNMKSQRADSLNTDGLYSIVRNPLYIGNLFGIIGFSMLSQNYEIVVINVLLFSCFYVPIIMREEQFLLDNFKEEFLEYAICTPAIIPNFRLWKKPQLKFNYLKLFYREHTTLLGIATAFFAAEMLREFSMNNIFVLDTMWTSIFTVTLLFWMVLRIFKKKFKTMDRIA
ncbi:MAG: hypothetical protein A2Y10_04125 [Planctomycetes bacterium GWF2_41_51]|nr:MAG: hypothetical protein A2Y10_04125 [Planctomycetes bacterium GWF2_41_51]HBG26488.1 hypothetical protein [Phycisphaerales bacterium]